MVAKTGHPEKSIIGEEGIPHVSAEGRSWAVERRQGAKKRGRWLVGVDAVPFFAKPIYGIEDRAASRHIPRFPCLSFLLSRQRPEVCLGL